MPPDRKWNTGWSFPKTEISFNIFPKTCRGRKKKRQLVFYLMIFFSDVHKLNRNFKNGTKIFLIYSTSNLDISVKELFELVGYPGIGGLSGRVNKNWFNLYLKI